MERYTYLDTNYTTNIPSTQGQPLHRQCTNWSIDGFEEWGDGPTEEHIQLAQSNADEFIRRFPNHLRDECLWLVASQYNRRSELIEAIRTHHGHLPPFDERMQFPNRLSKLIRRAVDHFGPIRGYGHTPIFPDDGQWASPLTWRRDGCKRPVKTQNNKKYMEELLEKRKSKREEEEANAKTRVIPLTWMTTGQATQGAILNENILMSGSQHWSPRPMGGQPQIPPSGTQYGNATMTMGHSFGDPRPQQRQQSTYGIYTPGATIVSQGFGDPTNQQQQQQQQSYRGMDQLLGTNDPRRQQQQQQRPGSVWEGGVSVPGPRDVGTIGMDDDEMTFDDIESSFVTPNFQLSPQEMSSLGLARPQEYASWDFVTPSEFDSFQDQSPF